MLLLTLPAKDFFHSFTADTFHSQILPTLRFYDSRYDLDVFQAHRRRPNMETGNLRTG